MEPNLTAIYSDCVRLTPISREISEPVRLKLMTRSPGASLRYVILLREQGPPAHRVEEINGRLLKVRLISALSEIPLQHSHKIGVLRLPVDLLLVFIGFL
jgi:hypothetical protein